MVGSLLTDPPVSWVERCVGLFELFGLAVYELVNSLSSSSVLSFAIQYLKVKCFFLWLGIRGLWYFLLSLLRWFVVFLLPKRKRTRLRVACLDYTPTG